MESPRHDERHLASHVFNVLVMVVCIGALAWMVHELGWQRAREVLADVGPWFGMTVALDLVGLSCDAAAIHAFMRPEARMVSFWRVLGAQISGRAINILTPGGALGEATKVTMLVGHAPRDRVVSSIVLFNLTTFYLLVAIVLVGVPITIVLVDLPHHLRVIIWIGLAVVVALALAIGVAIHRGASATVLDTARAVRLLSPERAAKLKIRLAEVDRHLRELQTARSPGTRRAIAFLATSQACAWTATTILLHAVGVRISFHFLVGVFSVGVLIGWISSIVPLGLAISDGSNYALFQLLGASGAQGMFVALTNRARSMTLAMIGLVVMGVTHTANRISIERRRNRRRAAQAS